MKKSEQLYQKAIRWQRRWNGYFVYDDIINYPGDLDMPVRKLVRIKRPNSKNRDAVSWPNYELHGSNACYHNAWMVFECECNDTAICFGFKITEIDGETYYTAHFWNKIGNSYYDLTAEAFNVGYGDKYLLLAEFIPSWNTRKIGDEMDWRQFLEAEIKHEGIKAS